MKKTVFLLFLMFPVLGLAQNPTPAPTPVSTPFPRPTPIFRPTPLNNILEARSRLLLEEQRRFEERRKKALQIVDELYRKPTKKELLQVAIDQDLLEKYAQYGKNKSAGIIRLLTDKDCSKNSRIVVASEDCLNNTMPGTGAFFSFRTNNYRIANLADLSLFENSFVSNSLWQHGFLADIGNIALENITLELPELAYLQKFQPALEYQSAQDIDYKLANGIKNNLATFRRSAKVRENSTYILRSIAYRGELIKSVQGLLYNEFNYDKREDIIVAFRVVRQHSDASVTIIWKEILTRKSPKIERIKDKTKIKENNFVAIKRNGN